MHFRWHGLKRGFHTNKNKKFSSIIKLKFYFILVYDSFNINYITKKHCSYEKCIFVLRHNAMLQRTGVPVLEYK